MSDNMEFEHVTSNAAVATFNSSGDIFEGLLKEVRELSKKKSEATMSASKVRLINRVLEDLLTILKDEPSGKYLEVLNDEDLPQMSDAVLTIVQFETARASFRSLYRKYMWGAYYWITDEQIAEWQAVEE
mgnify:CR=1 FL=1